MISYFTKQFQAAPALNSIYQQASGVFVTTRSNTKRAIQQLDASIQVIMYTEKLKQFSKGYRQLANSNLIVTGAPYTSTFKAFDAKKFMIFTGTSPALTTKQIRESHAHFDLLCAIGPRMMRVIAQSEVNVESIQAGYFPFLSFPEKTQELKKEVLSKINLDERLPTIAYVPRGEPNGSLDIMLNKIVEAVSLANFNLIIRPHPSQSVKLHLRDKVMFAFLRAKLKRFTNVFLDLNSLKLSSLLASADLVISDANSPAEEALFYDMPQLLIQTNRLSKDILSHKMKLQGASDEDIELAMRVYDNGFSISPETSNIVQIIESALIDENRFKSARNENFAFVFGERDFRRQLSVIDRIASFRTSGSI